MMSNILRAINFLCEKQERIKLDAGGLKCLIYPVFLLVFTYVVILLCNNL